MVNGDMCVEQLLHYILTKQATRPRKILDHELRENSKHSSLLMHRSRLRRLQGASLAWTVDNSAETNRQKRQSRS